MDKERRIIQPGDPEWVEAQDTVQDLLKNDKIKTVQPQTPLEVQLTKKDYPWGHLEYAIVPQGETTVRIVFHFKKLSRDRMGRLGEFLAIEVAQKMKPQAAIEAGPSPLGEDGILDYRSQWDMILSYVPKVYGEITLNGILRILEKFEG